MRVFHPTSLPVGELCKELISCLRQGKTTRKPRSGGVDRRNQIPDLVSIHVRPPEVEDRLEGEHPIYHAVIDSASAGEGSDSLSA